MRSGPLPTAARSSVKVVVTGSYGAGKTSLVSSLSQITVLSAEHRMSTPFGGAVGRHSVGLDFGRMKVGGEVSLHLFGTPGRDQFDLMWPVVSDGLLGYIVLIDDSRPDSSIEAMDMLTYFRDRVSVPYVIAVNKVAPANADRGVKRARHSLRVPDPVRVVPVDVRQHPSAKQVMLELLFAARDDAGSGRGTDQAGKPAQAARPSSTGP